MPSRNTGSFGRPASQTQRTIAATQRTAQRRSFFRMGASLTVARRRRNTFPSILGSQIEFFTFWRARLVRHWNRPPQARFLHAASCPILALSRFPPYPAAAVCVVLGGNAPRLPCHPKVRSTPTSSARPRTPPRPSATAVELVRITPRRPGPCARFPRADGRRPATRQRSG